MAEKSRPAGGVAAATSDAAGLAPRRVSLLSRLLRLHAGIDRPARPADVYPPAYDHGDLTPVGSRAGDAADSGGRGGGSGGRDDDGAPPPDGVWTVSGMFATGGPLQIARTMTVVRTAGELTVVNAVRLSDRGEAALARLGRVARVVRLGAFHGVDDEYYRRVHGAALWAPAAAKTAAGADPLEGVLVDAEPSSARPRGEDDGGRCAAAAAAAADTAAGPLTVPIAGAGVAVLPTPYPEAVLYVPDLGPPGGLLLTADALIHVPAAAGRPPHINCLSAAFTRLLIASATPLRVAPLWLRAQIEAGAVPATLRDAYARLGRWRAGGVVTAHGQALLPDGGREGLRAAVAEAVDAALPPSSA